MTPTMQVKRKTVRDIVGLVPMAGRARRLAELPCSKEIYPLHAALDGDRTGTPRVVCEQLLGKMRDAGVDNIYVVLREGKWDIPAFLGDGSSTGVHLAYLMMGLPYGTPYSADQAWPFVRHSLVAFGFPDMLFGPEDLFGQLLEHQDATAADVVLGLFPADRPHKSDMVEADAGGEVRQIVIKPARTGLQYTWGVAVWAPAFTDFLHEFLARHRQGAAAGPELFIGDVIQAAIRAGMNVRAVPVSEQPFLDIGTPEDLERAVKPSPR
jgi:glucose-1-phosphate thymidylyltransferase